MNAAELRDRLTRTRELEVTTFPHRAVGLLDKPSIAAAVLVAFVLGREPGVLLTKRTAHLSTHAGQVAFPGGRVDPGDANAEAAALREAREEIGLESGKVELIGRLGDLVTGTGYRITPVMGLLPEGVELEQLGLVPSPDEVEAIFTLKLSVLIDPAGPSLQRVHSRGTWRDSWVWPHDTHFIFGATAEMLINLAGRLRAGDAAV